MAPLVGVLGNDAIALSVVMTMGMVVALFALAPTLRGGYHHADGASAVERADGVIGDAVPEPA